MESRHLHRRRHFPVMAEIARCPDPAFSDTIRTLRTIVTRAVIRPTHTSAPGMWPASTMPADTTGCRGCVLSTASTASTT